MVRQIQTLEAIAKSAETSNLLKIVGLVLAVERQIQKLMTVKNAGTEGRKVKL